jgi:hypothetical protein
MLHSDEKTLANSSFFCCQGALQSVGVFALAKQWEKMVESKSK